MTGDQRAAIKRRIQEIENWMIEHDDAGGLISELQELRAEFQAYKDAHP